MKILAIRGKNLTSLAGEFCVDFTQEPLRSAGIFAITGETGAGKSTLLDAMCLALFANTPRLHKAKDGSVKIQDGKNEQLSQDDVKGLLRKGTAEGYAEVDFIGQDGAAYSARWSVRRAYGKVDGKMQSDSVELTNLGNQEKLGEKKKETLEEIERLVGLNFEQFTRSVLLAQGEFTAFMKADRNEKGALLEKLTGTEIFSQISQKIYYKWKDANEELQSVIKSLSGITLLTEEDLQALKDEKLNLEGLIKEVEQQKKSLDKDLAWYETLAKLRKLTDEATEVLESANNAYVQAEGRRQSLQLIEKTQGARPLLNNRDYSLKHLVDKEKEEGDLRRAIAVQENALKANTSLQKQTKEVLIEAEQEYQASQQSIKTARALDVQIESKAKELKLALDEQETATHELQSRTEEILKAEGEAAQLRLEMDRLNQWKEKNKAGEVLASNIITITSKLEDCAALLVKLKKLSDDFQDIEQQLAITRERIITQEELLATLAEPITAKKKVLQDLTEVKEALDIHSLQNRKRFVQPRIREITAAKETWRVFYEKKNQQLQMEAELQENRNELAEKGERLKELRQDLSRAEVQKKQAEKLLEAAKLAIAEDTEALRANLKNGEECPVCGSTHHPHVGEEKKLYTVIDGIQQEVYQCASAYLELLQETTALEQVCASLKSSISNGERAYGELCNQVLGLEKQWQQLKIQTECAVLAPEIRADWFVEELEKLNKESDELDLRIERYNELVRAIEEQKQELDDAILKHGDCQRALEKLKNDKGIFALKLEQQQKVLEESQRQLQDNRSCLDVYASKESWFEDWQKDPVQYVNSVNNFVTKWNNAIAQTAANETKLQVLTAQLSALNKELEGCMHRASKADKTLQEQQQKNNEFLQARNNLFDGRPIDQVEQEFQDRLRILKESLKKCDEAVIKDKETLSTKKGSLAQILTDIEENKVKLDEYSDELDQWLINFSNETGKCLEIEELRSLVYSEQKWIEEERQELKEIHEKRLKATATFEERNRSLEQHKIDGHPGVALEELKAGLNQVSIHLEDKKEEKERLSLKLGQDELARRQNDALLKERASKAQISERWKKISDLIGSADGNSFRLLAQEYTLDILLGYANIHLKQLNRRYRLERTPNSLVLQIIDEDMGGEVRPVHTLSGGECFLTSLALALGLASLSSKRLQVESLFIDEGFGSLDPESLRIAMDALEGLQNQGRKVGVISHVQDMTERIQTQIAVKKVSADKSRIEILGLIN